MEGKLVKIKNEWFVEKTLDKDTKIYPLSPESKKLISDVEKDIKTIENTKVIFNEIIEGKYCETKETLIKTYFAKINNFKRDQNL